VVKDAIREGEDEVRYHLGLSLSEFNAMDYEGIVFHGRMLSRDRQQRSRRGMIEASFTAWQIMRGKGYKKTFKQHLKALGLAPKKKIDKETAQRTREEADKIYKRYGTKK